MKRTVLTLFIALSSASLLCASTRLLTVVFEYTVASNGSRQNINMVMCQDALTKQMLPNALTEKEKKLGAGLIAHRKSPNIKFAGQKRYEFLLFDPDTRQYRE